MEARKITVVSTKGTNKVVLMSTAENLGDLKADLRENGVDYDGMTFYEGLSKTELRADDAILPHDVPYKGTTTNELVFMLTNSDKKIRSGAMSRTEAYAAIKELELQNSCVETFGKNFTLCKTTDLESLIENAKAKEQNEFPEEFDFRGAIECLVSILSENYTISSREEKLVIDTLYGVNTKEDDSPYSDEDIDAMFRDME